MPQKCRIPVSSDLLVVLRRLNQLEPSSIYMINATFSQKLESDVGHVCLLLVFLVLYYVLFIC